MSDAAPAGTPSGLNSREAREFHAIFLTSFIFFTAVAIVAHILVWLWRPWFPGEDGYSMINNATDTLTSIATFLV